MLIDVLTFKAHLAEIESALKRAVIEKIITLTSHRFSLIFNTQENSTLALLIDVSTKSPHLLLTKEKFKRGQHTPFSQSLDKHLLGARVVKVSQVGFDYLARLDFSVMASNVSKQEISLLIEMCSRKANLVLMQSKSGVIIDVNTKVTAKKNRFRTLLPGDVYQPPPQPAKINPYQITEADWTSTIKNDPASLVWGINEHILNEVKDDFLKLQNILNISGLNCHLYNINETYHILPIKLKKRHPQQSYPTINEALVDFYQRIYPVKLLNESKLELKRVLMRHKARLTRRLDNIENDLNKANNAMDFQRYADLIYANLVGAKITNNKVKLKDFFHDDTPDVVIEINPTKTLLENAQHFYEQAKRARRGLKMIQKRLGKTHEEIVNFDNDLANVDELPDIESVQSLAEKYQIHTRSVPKKQHKPVVQDPRFKFIYRFVRDENYQFWVGKNQRGNDQLHKLVKGNDVWMHALGYPGSHLVIKSKRKGQEIPLEVLLEAASIAAFYSQAQKKEKVEIDYTKRKYVLKQKGKVGAVTYSQQKTLLVTPKPFTSADSD